MTESGAREFNVDTPHLRLSGKAWGPEHGPPVLALHGWLDNAASFDALAPHLSEHRVLALDLPGHGRSAHHAPGHLYGFVDLVAEVWQAAEALRLGSFSLLGHSLGAAIAGVLAGTFPDRVTSLALIEGLGPLSETAEGTPDRLARSLADEQRRRGREKRRFPTLEAAAERLASARDGLSSEAARILAARGLTSTEDGARVWSADAALRMASRSRLTEPQVQAFLRAIACPVLLIRAEPGWPVDPAAMQARMDCVQRLQLHRLRGGHHLHLDDAASVAALVRPFLNPAGTHG